MTARPRDSAVCNSVAWSGAMVVWQWCFIPQASVRQGWAQFVGVLDHEVLPVWGLVFNGLLEWCGMVWCGGWQRSWGLLSCGAVPVHSLLVGCQLGSRAQLVCAARGLPACGG
jgi:hypothetical protein